MDTALRAGCGILALILSAEAVQASRHGAVQGLIKQVPQTSFSDAPTSY